MIQNFISRMRIGKADGYVLFCLASLVLWLLTWQYVDSGLQAVVALIWIGFQLAAASRIGLAKRKELKSLLVFVLFFAGCFLTFGWLTWRDSNIPAIVLFGQKIERFQLVVYVTSSCAFVILFIQLCRLAIVRWVGQHRLYQKTLDWRLNRTEVLLAVAVALFMVFLFRNFVLMLHPNVGGKVINLLRISAWIFTIPIVLGALPATLMWTVKRLRWVPLMLSGYFLSMIGIRFLIEMEMSMSNQEAVQVVKGEAVGFAISLAAMCMAFFLVGGLRNAQRQHAAKTMIGLGVPPCIAFGSLAIIYVYLVFNFNLALLAQWPNNLRWEMARKFRIYENQAGVDLDWELPDGVYPHGLRMRICIDAEAQPDCLQLFGSLIPLESVRLSRLRPDIDLSVFRDSSFPIIVDEGTISLQQLDQLNSNGNSYTGPGLSELIVTGLSDSYPANDIPTVTLRNVVLHEANFHSKNRHNFSFQSSKPELTLKAIRVLSQCGFRGTVRFYIEHDLAAKSWLGLAELSRQCRVNLIPFNADEVAQDKWLANFNLKLPENDIRIFVNLKSRGPKLFEQYVWRLIFDSNAELFVNFRGCGIDDQQFECLWDGIIGGKLSFRNLNGGAQSRCETNKFLNGRSLLDDFHTAFELDEGGKGLWLPSSLITNLYMLRIPPETKLLSLNPHWTTDLSFPRGFYLQNGISHLDELRHLDSSTMNLGQFACFDGMTSLRHLEFKWFQSNGFPVKFSMAPMDIDVELANLETINVFGEPHPAFLKEMNKLPKLKSITIVWPDGKLAQVGTVENRVKQVLEDNVELKFVSESKHRPVIPLEFVRHRKRVRDVVRKKYLN